MVKSKKMSKTSIAVIILALLLVLSMVLGLTGAWFTQSDKTDSTLSNELKFGVIGSVTVEATDIVHERWDATLNNGEGDWADITEESGSVVMPGDKVTAGGLIITHDDTNVTEEEVYFLIYDGTSYYNVDAIAGSAGAYTADHLVAITSNGAAQELAVGGTLTIAGHPLSIQIDGKWYTLDGVRDTSQTGSGADDNRYHSWEIPSVGVSATEVEGSELADYPAKIGAVVYSNEGVNYVVGIMQTTNATAQQAYAALQTVCSSAFSA